MKQIPASIFSHLFALGRLMRSRMSAALPLTLSQVEALHYICEEGWPTMRQLAVHLHVKAPTATAQVDELARAGLITRKEGADRREVTVGLTRKGTTLLNKVAAKRKAVITEVLSPLSPKDQAEFDRLLHVIIKTHC